MYYLLGTDIGTSGTKTILTDLKGNVLAQDLQETDILTPHPLWAEQWPDVWLNAAKTSIKNAVAKSGVKAEDIKAIAISGLYGGSGIPLDVGGEPVRPCMIWMDRRAQKESDWALETIGKQRLLEITHNGADPYYGYTKMLWMKRNEPENWAKTKLFLPPNDYVIYRLTGEAVIDYSSAGNIGGIFDMNTRTWSQEMLDVMGIPLSLMPQRLVESTDVAAMLIFFLTFASTEEVVPPSVQNETSALKDNIKAMTGQAWLVMIFNFLYFALYVVRSTTVIYFFKYNLQQEDLATLVGFLGILSGLPMLLCLPKLEEKFGKRNILFLSVAIYLAGDALILINQTSVAFQLTGLVITGLGIYGIFGTVFAMQPDAIDYSEWKKNRSISGTIAAFQGLFVKASMGLASWIIGLYLGMNGYDGAASTQIPAAQQCIQFCYMWIPVILCVLLAVTNVFWKLDACADEMRAELDARRKKLQELIDKW